MAAPIDPNSETHDLAALEAIQRAEDVAQTVALWKSSKGMLELAEACLRATELQPVGSPGRAAAERLHIDAEMACAATLTDVVAAGKRVTR